MPGWVLGALYDDVLEHLRLGRARVAEEQHVDVSANAVLVLNVLLLSAEHGHRHRRLDVLVPVDRRGQALNDPLPDVRVLCQLPDPPNVLLGNVVVVKNGLQGGVCGVGVKRI